MAARGITLPEYRRLHDGHAVYAAKVTRMEPCVWAQNDHPGATTLWMDDINTKSNMILQWVEIHKPTTGGYFVVDDAEDGTTRCTFSDAARFESDYERL